MKQKILLVSVRADFGGGPEHLYQLVSNFREKYEPYVAIPFEDPYFSKLKKIIPVKNMINIPHRKFRIRALFDLLRFINQNKIIIIHSHGKGAGVYSRLIKLFLPTKTKIVHTFHGISTGEYNQFQKLLYIAYERFLSHLTNKFIFVSNSEFERALCLKLIQIKKANVIFNGTPTYSDEDIKEIQSFSLCALSYKITNKPIIVTTSRFDYPKNMAFAYQIATRRPQYLFLWLGNGPDFHELHSRSISENISNIIFAGFVSDPVKYIAKSNLYLSTSRWEGLPLSLLESMSVGVPIVATDVVGNKDVISDSRVGSLYSLGDLESALKEIDFWINKSNVKSSSSKIKMIHNSLFSTKRMCDEVSELYMSL